MVVYRCDGGVSGDARGRQVETLSPRPGELKARGDVTRSRHGGGGMAQVFNRGKLMSEQ